MRLGTADNCPACSESLIGPPIPEESRDLYGRSTHFRRVIGIEHRGRYDGVSEWECPYCGYAEDRFTGQEIRAGRKDSDHKVKAQPVSLKEPAA